MNNKLNIFFLLISISLYSQEPNSIEQKVFQPEELIEDFRELFVNLEGIHPDLYFYTSKETIDSLRLQAENEFTMPMTALEF